MTGDRQPFLTDVSGKDSFETVPTSVDTNFIFANYVRPATTALALSIMSDLQGFLPTGRLAGL